MLWILNGMLSGVVVLFYVFTIRTVSAIAHSVDWTRSQGGQEAAVGATCALSGRRQDQTRIWRRLEDVQRFFPGRGRSNERQRRHIQIYT